MSLNTNAIVTLQEQKTYQEETTTNQDSLLEILINAVSTFFEGLLRGQGSKNLKETTYTDEYINGSGKTYLLLPNFPIISISAITEGGATLTENTHFTVDKQWGILWKESGKWAETRRNVKITYKAGYADADKMDFDSGSEEPAIGATLTSASGSGVVTAVKVTSGTWAGGDVVGYVEFSSITGEFKNNETVDISGGNSNVMTVNEPAGSAKTIAGIPDDLKLACMEQVAVEHKRATKKEHGELSRSFGDGSISKMTEENLLPYVKEILRKYMRQSL
jgi:hypothetical protein